MLNLVLGRTDVLVASHLLWQRCSGTVPSPVLGPPAATRPPVLTLCFAPPPRPSPPRRQVNRTLRQLVIDLDANDVSGPAELANALRSNTTMTELSLGESAALDEPTAAAIAGTLRVNKFISSIGGGGLDGGAFDAPAPSPFMAVNGGMAAVNGGMAAPALNGPAARSSASSPDHRSRPPGESPEPVTRGSPPRPSPPNGGAPLTSRARGGATARSSIGPGCGVSWGDASAAGASAPPTSSGRAAGAAPPLPTPEPTRSRSQMSTSERYRAAALGPCSAPVPVPGGGSSTPARLAGPPPSAGGGTPGGRRASTGGGGRSLDLSRPPEIDMHRPQDTALVGLHGRMEQLAAAMEIRLQAHEAAMEAVRGELAAERKRGDALEEALGFTAARLRHALDEAVNARRAAAEQAEAEETAWRAAADERAGLRADIEAVRAAADEADQRGRAVAAAQADRIEALQELQAQARAAAASDAAELRHVADGTRGLLAVAQAEQAGVAKRVADDLRGLDAHAARAQEEAEARTAAAISALRDELVQRCEGESIGTIDWGRDGGGGWCAQGVRGRETVRAIAARAAAPGRRVRRHELAIRVNGRRVNGRREAL